MSRPTWARGLKLTRPTGLHETVTKKMRETVLYLVAEVNDYWGNRKKIIEILRYLN